MPRSRLTHQSADTADDPEGLEMTVFSPSDGAQPSSDSLDDALKFTSHEVRALRALVNETRRKGPRCSVDYCCTDPDKKSRPWRTPCCWAVSLLLTACTVAYRFCGAGGMLDFCEEGGFLRASADCAPITSTGSLFT